MERKLEISDLVLTLAVLDTSGGEIEGRTRFQKMVYLLKNSFNAPFSFEFRTYFYGPYSVGLADGLQLLKSVEMIEEDRIEIARDVAQYNYRLTDSGRQFLRKYLPKKRGYERIHTQIEKGVRTMSTLPTGYLVSVSKKHYTTIEKAFYFRRSEKPDGFTGEFAISLEEFIKKVKTIDREILKFHFHRGDFEKWFSEVLKADKLAEKIERLRKENLPIDDSRRLLLEILLAKEN